MTDSKQLIFKQTAIFKKWLASLKNLTAKQAILKRLRRAEYEGLLGDVKNVGEGVFEMRFFIGAGYRLYYTQQNGVIYWLLCGGDKSTQSADIEKAKIIKRALDN